MYDSGHSLFRLRLTAALLIAAVLLVSPLPASALEKATIQLKWLHHFQFAGYYAALEKGFYRDAGLDVTILEGGPSVEVEKYVASGRVDFGVGTSALLINRAQGQDFVVLGQVFQHSPAIFLTPRKTGIQSVADMAGRRLMYANNHGDMLALLKRNGIKEQQMTKVPHDGDPHDLISGKADVMLAYSFNEPLELEKAGESYLTFSPLSLGIDFYGDNFFTTRSVVEKRPEFVRAFREATLRGWLYAMDNKAEIADLILAKYSQSRNREWLMFEANQMDPLIQPKLVELGYQSPTRWRHISETFIELGMLPKGFDPTPIIYAPGQRINYRPIIIIMLVCSVIIGSLIWLVMTFRRLNRSLNEQIGERKRAEEALVGSYKLLQTIINTVPMRVFWKDVTFNYLGCNNAFARDAGCVSPEDVIGKHDYQLSWKENADTYRADDTLVIESGQQKLSYDEQQTTPDGKQIWLRTSKVPLRNEAGDITGVLGIYEDITEYKKSELANTRFLLRQRAILDNLPMMAWLKDTDSRLEMVNELFARSCGRTVEECIGKTDLELYPLDMATGFLADDREVCATGRNKRVEEVITTPDGIKWHLTYKTPIFDEQGRVVGSAGIAQDITELKELEIALYQSAERHRTILQTAMDGFWVLDMHGHILEANETLCRLTGYSADELLSRHITDLEVAEAGEEVATHFLKIMERGEDRFETRFRRKDGNVINVEVSAQHRHIDKGLIVAFIRDITQRKQAEKELQKKNTEIEQFIYTVSHDLRSPLVTVKTFLGFLGQDLSSGDRDRITKDLEYIDSAADRMKALLDELLDLSRVGRMSDVYELITFQELVTEALDSLAGQITTGKVDIRVSESNQTLYGDRRRLLQIWQNLLDNALKYMGEQPEPLIRIGVEQLQGVTTFIVCDNGIGIETKYHDKIFGIFEKLDRSSGGVGMGLTMVNRIVETYGGKIRVESDGTGAGTCFLFTLPHAVQ